MAAFKKSGGFRNDKRGGGSFRSSGDRPSFPRQGRFENGQGRNDSRGDMFTATCAACSKHCEVPFRPSGARPVYCKDCFGGSRDVSRHDGSRHEAPRKFESRGVTPAQNGVGDTRVLELTRQVEALHKKIDEVTTILLRMVPVNTSESPKAITPKKKPAEKKLVLAAVKKPAKVTKVSKKKTKK